MEQVFDMSERQLQFRVGLFVIAAVVVGVILTVKFGQLQRYTEPRYVVGIEFDEITGISAGTPVRQSGLPIGEVRKVSISEKSRKVVVIAEIREQYQLAEDARPTISQSLLGDAHIAFSLGKSEKMVPNGFLFQGVAQQDPMQAVQKLESRMNETMQSFAATSQEWQKVAKNVNSLIETNQGSIDEMVEQAAISLRELTIAMQKASTTLDEANSFIADPELQQSVKEAMVALPRLIKQTDQLIQQTQQTMQTTNHAVTSLGNTMDNLETVTNPLAANSDELVTRMSRTLVSLDETLTQLSKFTRQLNEGDGSLQRLTRDSRLYTNLQVSTSSLAALMKNLEPMMKDLRIFSDKIARHPEILGVSGYLRGSSGVKESVITPASSTAPSQLRGSADDSNRFFRSLVD